MSKNDVPLVVDLDEALTYTDTLWECLYLSIRHQPLSAFRFPFWLLRGKAGFKDALAGLVLPDPSLLPYNPKVLELLETSKTAERRIILATGANQRIAELVANHLGCFTDVLSSDETTNLTGDAKLRAVKALLQDEPFDYVGDQKAAAPLFNEARKSYLVAGSLPKTNIHDLELLPNGSGGLAKNIVRLLRPHQWAKNVLLFLPLIFAQEIFNGTKVFQLVLAFFSFSLVASAGYIVNDSLDLEADRIHPNKKKRPLASGAVPLSLVGPLLFVVGGLGATLGAIVSLKYLALVCGYLCLSLSYSTYLKQKVVVDVIFLSLLYTLRLLAGGVAAEVNITHWMLAFSVFFFTSLAFLKRYTELLGATSNDSLKSRGYRKEDLPLLESFGSSSGLLAVLVFALYINSGALEHYVFQDVLWLICPILLYWITRIWLLAGRGELPHDPVVFALKDRGSWAAGVAVAILLVIAAAPF